MTPVPTNDPVNDPVNGTVNVLNCNELDTTPGNNSSIWAELVTTPPPNAVMGILPLRIRLPNIEVFDGIEILVIKDIMYK
jgi:hypothetical protein